MSACTRIVAISVLITFTGCQSIASDPVLRLTLKAVDDEGKPVEGAKASFGGERRPKNPDESSKGVSIEGLTDAQGIFSGELEVWNATQSGYSVEKPGYYPVTQHSYSAKSVVRGKWQPWNPTIEVVLKRKKNPVPMYAKRVEVKIPEFNRPVGYDLVQGDWVAPYGKGQIPDLIFEADRKVQSDQEYDGTLTLRFSNEGDGLLAYEIAQPDPPDLRMPYKAPEDGYVSTKVWQESRHTSGSGDGKIISTTSSRMNYFIRVRTMRDKDGKVISALYGKIHGDFRWFIGARAPKSGLAFTYYLNPDGTRNMEFDTARNLLKSAKREDPDFQGLTP